MYARVRTIDNDGRAHGTICYIKLNENHYLSSEVSYFGIPETRHELTDEGKDYAKQVVAKHHEISEWNWHVIQVEPCLPTVPPVY